MLHKVRVMRNPHLMVIYVEQRYATAANDAMVLISLMLTLLKKCRTFSPLEYLMYGRRSMAQKASTEI